MVTQTPDDEHAFWEGEAQDSDLWNGTPEETAAHLARVDRVLSPLLELGATAIDLGAGNGRLLVPMAEAHPRATFWAVDVTHRAFPRPRNTSLMLADGGRRLVVAAGQVDAGWSVLLFQHLPELAVRGYLAEMARVLKPGGCFVFQWVARDDGDPPDRDFNYRYSSDAMGSWALDAGFDSIEVGGDPDHPEWRWADAWVAPVPAQASA